MYDALATSSRGISEQTLVTFLVVLTSGTTEQRMKCRGKCKVINPLPVCLSVCMHACMHVCLFVCHKGLAKVGWS